LNRYTRRYEDIQSKGFRNRHRIVRIAALYFAVLIALTFYSVWSRSFVMEQSIEMENLRTEYLELSCELDVMRKELYVLKSRESIIRRASSELHMVFPELDDLVFVVMDRDVITNDDGM